MMQNSLELEDVGYFCILVYGLSANSDIKGARVYRRKSPELLPVGDESIEAAYRFELYKMTHRVNEKLSVVAYGLRAARDNHNVDIRDLDVVSNGTYSFDSIMNKCEWVDYDDGYPLPKRKEDWTPTSFIKDMMLNVLPHPVDDAALLRVYCRSDVFGLTSSSCWKKTCCCLYRKTPL